MATIVVAGALANKPFSGGEAWVRLSWVLGLRRLGFDVVFVEQLADAAWDEAAPARAYFADVMAEFELRDRAALVRGGGPETAGIAWEELLALVEGADLLVNISGHLGAATLPAQPARRAFVDIDPGYTQIWHDQGLVPIEPHDTYFTIAENIGRPECDLPPSGLPWRTCRQPVVLDEWPVRAPAEPGRFTTVATWRTPFGRLEHAGRTYGMKLDAFRAMVALPDAVDARFELALDIHPAEAPDIALLDRHGWAVVDARARTRGPDAFRRYVSGSAAEFSPAQGVYADTNSGWFSDRSARYLAAGKPVLVQDTGFARMLPVGEGLLAFASLDEAVAGAQAIAADPDRHAAAARAVAEEHFASDVVLTRFLEDALA